MVTKSGVVLLATKASKPMLRLKFVVFHLGYFKFLSSSAFSDFRRSEETWKLLLPC